MTARAWLAAALVALAPGCGQRTEWYVTVSTSAYVPQQGDRVLVEVLDANGNLACDDCSHVIDGSSENRWPMTFSIVPTDSKVRLRGRLYRSYGPPPDKTDRLIDVTGYLPKLNDTPIGGIRNDVYLTLPVLCFGYPADVAAGNTCQLVPAPGGGYNAGYGPEPSLDTILLLDPFGEPRDCKAQAPPGMICVGGGGFLLGDDRLEASAFDFPARPESSQFVAALWIDEDEMTVGTVRKLVAANKLPVEDATLRPRGPGFEMCNYLGANDPTNDALPINCIDQSVADDVCTLLDKRLPREIEWEFAAGNGGAETTYPWGNAENADSAARIQEDDATICDRAVVGRGRVTTPGESTACDGAHPGPVAHGNPKDVTKKGVRNMAGNLAEWVWDDFALYGESCWSSSLDNIGLSGTCVVKNDSSLHGSFVSYRGGSWARAPGSAVGVGRYARADGKGSPYIGFRCATSDVELGVLPGP